MIDDIKQLEPFFGSWYITKKIGQGSSGQLYQISNHDSLGNKYYSALKVISIPSGGESEIKSILTSGVTTDELESYYNGLITNSSTKFNMLSNLKDNAHIISYYDHKIIKKDNEFGWLVLIRMELASPLIDYSLNHEITEKHVLKIGIDMCLGLSICSKNKIIHRDIKPENIFVSDNGDFKIGDFGIATIINQTQTFLSRKGTYTYMAPEIYKGEKYSENIDLYSLGLIMYKYLNHGRAPFMPKYPKKVNCEDNEYAFTKRMSGYSIPAPSHGSPRLKEIVLKACEYNPKDRYDNADEMLQDLEELREKEHVSV